MERESLDNGRRREQTSRHRDEKKKKKKERKRKTTKFLSTGWRTSVYRRYHFERKCVYFAYIWMGEGTFRLNFEIEFRIAEWRFVDPTD